MPTVSANYSTAIFNAIPTLAESAEILRNKDPLFYCYMRDALASCKLNDTFGIILVHAHFPLKENQILVKLYHETTPWTIDSGMIHDLNKIGETSWKEGKIYPTCWGITSEDKLMPYEFAYTNDKNKRVVDLRSQQYQAFISRFLEIVKDADLTNCVGLALVPDDLNLVDGAQEKIDHEKKSSILPLKVDCHKVVSPDHPIAERHKIQSSFFWPTDEDGTIPEKAVGVTCDSMDTFKRMHDVRNAAARHAETSPASRHSHLLLPEDTYRDMPGTPTQEAAAQRRAVLATDRTARPGSEATRSDCSRLSDML